MRGKMKRKENKYIFLFFWGGGEKNYKVSYLAAPSGRRKEMVRAPCGEIMTVIMSVT